MATISFPANLFVDLTAHLNKTPESIAFMLCSMPVQDGRFRVVDLRLIKAGSDLRSDDHCELPDDVRAEIIRWAWQADGCLVEAHSHGLLYGPAEFSRYDLRQLSQWVPHVQWRLRGRPYGALVSASREFDGIAWMGGHPESIEQIEVDDGEGLHTTGKSFAALEELHAR